MFERTEILSITGDGSVKSQTVEAVRIPGRPLVRVHINEHANLADSAKTLRVIANYLDDQHLEKESTA